MSKVFLSISSSSPKRLLNGLPFENEPFLDDQGVCSAPCLWKKDSGSLVSGLRFIFLNIPPSLRNLDLFYLPRPKSESSNLPPYFEILDQVQENLTSQ